MALDILVVTTTQRSRIEAQRNLIEELVAAQRLKDIFKLIIQPENE